MTSIGWPYLNKIIQGYKCPEPVFAPPDYSNEVPVNNKDILETGIQRTLLFSALRLCTRGAARSVLIGLGTEAQ